MRRNMGTTDRALRVAIGLVLLSLTVFGPQTLWGLIGLVPLATAAIGFCPAYLPFGFTTRSTRVRRTA